MTSPSVRITHVIPHIGPTTIDLYPPATSMYTLLDANDELRRLQNLNHLGALSRALPGTRYTRWDYTVAMLYYAQHLELPRMNTAFSAGRQSLSSRKAALQTIALSWNIGHLPGTFSVEKGVYRYLREAYESDAADHLPWPDHRGRHIAELKNQAARLLDQQDYTGLARVLAVIKLLRWLTNVDHAAPNTNTDMPGSRDDHAGCNLQELLFGFIGPFLLSSETVNSRQWHMLRRAFEAIRHLAYLTLDVSVSGLTWCPPIHNLFRQEIARTDAEPEEFADRVAEVLSPIERLVYASLYHSEAARTEAAIVADMTHQYLRENSDVSGLLEKWMRQDSDRDLPSKDTSPSAAPCIAASIRLRTHFASPRVPPVKIESSLRCKGFPFPLALKYRAWNSEALTEPDELIVDALTCGNPGPNDVGRLLIWVMRELDAPKADPHDTFKLLAKLDLDKVYRVLFSRAFELSLPGKTMRLEPWPLTGFGLFPKGLSDETPIYAWACDRYMDGPILRHMFYDRTERIPKELGDRYAELIGLKRLRAHLRGRWRRKDLRQRCILVTASVRLCDSEGDLIEFDGGIAVISSRSGRITWYGSESKRGSGDPRQSLDTRLKKAGLAASTTRISKRYAFATVVLKRPLV